MDHEVAKVAMAEPAQPSVLAKLGVEATVTQEEAGVQVAPEREEAADQASAYGRSRVEPKRPT